MDTLINGWMPYVRSDVYEGVVNEDGDRGDALAFYVVVENERGVRFASQRSFTTEDFSRDEAEARAERLCLKVATSLRAGADPSTSAKWSRVGSAYGSESWSPTEDLEDEARALEMEAGPQEADRFRQAAGLGG